MAQTAGQALLSQLKIRVILCCVALFLIGMVAWLVYGWHSVNQGKRSQLILSECIDEYQKMFEAKDAMWSEVLLMNELGCEQVSSLKPYFWIMEAQALARQGKLLEAISLLDRAESSLPFNLPYKNYYHLTKVLIQLDMQDESLQQQGLSELQRLAYDEQNMFQDVALYYLAEYYAAYNEFEKAQEVRQLLLDGLETTFKNSSWAMQVRERFPVIV